jgi:hypothetical protein
MAPVHTMPPPTCYECVSALSNHAPLCPGDSVARPEQLFRGLPAAAKVGIPLPPATTGTSTTRLSSASDLFAGFALALRLLATCCPRFIPQIAVIRLRSGRGWNRFSAAMFIFILSAPAATSASQSVTISCYRMHCTRASSSMNAPTPQCCFARFLVPAHPFFPPRCLLQRVALRKQLFISCLCSFTAVPSAPQALIAGDRIIKDR